MPDSPEIEHHPRGDDDHGGARLPAYRELTTFVPEGMFEAADSRLDRRAQIRGPALVDGRTSLPGLRDRHLALGYAQHPPGTALRSWVGQRYCKGHCAQSAAANSA